MRTEIGNAMLPMTLEERLARSPAPADEVREKFEAFVGETFYTQMLKSLRSTVGKPAYMHGGQAEEMFRGLLDQVLAEDLAKATAHQFSGPMYELFSLQRT